MNLQRLLYGPPRRLGELLIRRWNWKSAFFSSLIRGLIFLFANFTAGWRAAVGAMLTEWCFRAITAGVFGAMTQSLAEAEPEWLAGLAAMVLLPLTSHSLEFLLHWMRRTPNLKTSIVSSVCFTILSTLFNFYAMRRGTMIVGKNARTLGADLRALPRVIGGFIAAVPIWIWRSLRSREA